MPYLRQSEEMLSVNTVDRASGLTPLLALHRRSTNSHSNRYRVWLRIESMMWVQLFSG